MTLAPVVFVVDDDPSEREAAAGARGDDQLHDDHDGVQPSVSCFPQKLMCHRKTFFCMAQAL